MLCSPKEPLGLRIFLKAVSLSIILGYMGCSHGERKVAVALGVVGAILFAYSRWVEPSWIEVTRH